MKIGIAPVSRSALSAAGIVVIDSWTPQEQEGFGQIMDGGFVRVPDLKINEETTIYFKLDVSNANPSNLKSVLWHSAMLMIHAMMNQHE